MIPTSWEISAGLTGAWRLLFLDRKALEYFEDSVEGFWKSFFAAVVILPGYLVIVWLHLAELEPTAGLLRIVLVEGIGYAVGWLAFPFVIFYLCETIGRSRRYLLYIVAYNWFQVALIGIYLPVRLILEAGLIPAPGGELFAFAIFLVMLAYRWYLARVGLEVGGWVASLMVMLDVIISAVILGTNDRMLMV